MALYQLVLKSGFDSDDSVRNIFTVGYDVDPIVEPDASDYVDAVFHAGLLGDISERWASTSLEIKRVNNDGDGWTTLTEFTHVLEGASSDDMLPRQMAAVIVGISASRKRGKKFFAGITEENQDGGVVSSDLLGHLVTSAIAYTSQFNGVHTILPGTTTPDPFDLEPFTGYRVNTIMGTQRRRKFGVGM
jgi:hypothetical protein